MGAETWLVGPVMATTYNDGPYQLRQVDEFMTWGADHGIK
jgi:hypothetical protein